MKSLRLLECNNFSEWDNFVKYSPQNNIFSHSWFLIERKRDYKFYFILKDDKIISSFILSLNSYSQTLSPTVSVSLSNLDCGQLSDLSIDVSQDPGETDIATSVFTSDAGSFD